LCFISVNHVHEQGADRRHEGHDRGSQAHAGYSAAYRQGLFYNSSSMPSCTAARTARALVRAASSTKAAVLSRAARSAAFKLLACQALGLVGPYCLITTKRRLKLAQQLLVLDGCLFQKLLLRNPQRQERIFRPDCQPELFWICCRNFSASGVISRWCPAANKSPAARPLIDADSSN
jgi:hypothetical protein